jgi:cytidine deaminase
MTSPPNDRVDELLAAATAARAQAYVPYSHFAVGAALLDDAGRIHAGCNVENAAYPQSQCAEASAIGNMVLGGGRRLRAVLVLADAPQPVTPCGGCRQRLREFGAADTAVYVANPQGVQQRFTLGGLLPASFGAEHLE